MTKEKPTQIELRQEQDKALLIEQLKKTPIIQVACEKTGTSRATYYRWRKEDDDFLKDADEAIHYGELLVNDMAESQLLTAIRDQNMSAIVFWLKHHHKAYATKVELSGKIKTEYNQLTPEQQEAITRALGLASLIDPEITNENI